MDTSEREAELAHLDQVYKNHVRSQDNACNITNLYTIAADNKERLEEMSIEFDNLLDASGDHIESNIALHHEAAEETRRLSSTPPAKFPLAAVLRQCSESLTLFLCRPGHGVARRRHEISPSTMEAQGLA